jgi:antitoxin YefM
MRTISYTKLRNELADTMSMVCENNSPVIVTRQSAKAVVMLSLDDYEAMEETSYLLRSPKNAARLAAAVKAIESGRAKKRKLKPT